MSKISTDLCIKCMTLTTLKEKHENSKECKAMMKRRRLEAEGYVLLTSISLENMMREANITIKQEQTQPYGLREPGYEKWVPKWAMELFMVIKENSADPIKHIQFLKRHGLKWKDIAEELVGAYRIAGAKGYAYAIQNFTRKD